MNDKNYLQMAVKQAKKSAKQGGFPAGAIVVKERKVISSGVSLGNKFNDPTGHAEISAMRNACKELRTTDLTGATLYASLQPCLMCFSVAYWAGIKRIVFGCKKTDEMVQKDYYEGKADLYEINKKNSRQIDLVYITDFEKESLELIKQWEKNA
ncbi:nucleoside deaminase [Candidatus Parcubacteria bacterium]|nr:nucleoside deaminase [Candidatus Parcubacteria bacterium]